MFNPVLNTWHNKETNTAWVSIPVNLVWSIATCSFQSFHSWQLKNGKRPREWQRQFPKTEHLRTSPWQHHGLGLHEPALTSTNHAAGLSLCACAWKTAVDILHAVSSLLYARNSHFALLLIRSRMITSIKGESSIPLIADKLFRSSTSDYPRHFLLSYAMPAQSSLIQSSTRAIDTLLTLLEKVLDESFWESMMGPRLVNLAKRYFGNDFVILSAVFYISSECHSQKWVHQCLYKDSNHSSITYKMDRLITTHLGKTKKASAPCCIGGIDHPRSSIHSCGWLCTTQDQDNPWFDSCICHLWRFQWWGVWWPNGR